MTQKIKLIENDIKSLTVPMESEMNKTVVHFDGELVKIRSGRAHTSLIEDLLVSCYGQAPAPLKTLAALSAPEVDLLIIQPWDSNIIDDIERGIGLSNLGLTPASDGSIIRLKLPRMSSARRDELVRVLGKKLEDAKVAVRNVRKDFHNLIRDSKKESGISENFFNRLSDSLQTVTDAFIKKLDVAAEKKKKELTSI